MLQAMIALREGDRQQAIDLIDRCAAWFDGRGQQSFAASLRHCQGRLIGGAAGADADAARQTVCLPRRASATRPRPSSRTSPAFRVR